MITKASKAVAEKIFKAVEEELQSAKAAGMPEEFVEASRKGLLQWTEKIIGILAEPIKEDEDVDSDSHAE